MKTNNNIFNQIRTLSNDLVNISILVDQNEKALQDLLTKYEARFGEESWFMHR